jgi:ATP-dependent DNA helicase RecG
MTTVAVSSALAKERASVGAALLSIPEDQWFDRKSARISPRELANSLIAMANAEGGWIVVGIHKDRVEGTNADVRRRNAQMQANIDYCVPPVHVRTELVECLRDGGQADQLLLFETDPSDVVHANVKDEVYLRVGDEDRRLSFAQRQELLYDKGQATYEARPVPGASLDEIEQELLEQYAEAIRAPDPNRLLQARGLADTASLTVAGCLLFARYPQGFLPEAFVRVLRYRGTDRGAGERQQLISDQRIEGPIPSLLLRAREDVQRVQPVRRALTASGRFGDVALIPEDAWLEGVVNAVVHRSYSVAGDHIRIEIFEDRIEISSPGRFPGLVDLSDPVRMTRFARNPRIARVCADLSFGQELGEGIRRMFEEMRLAGLNDPIYRQTSGSVQLTLLAEPVDRALQERLPEHARAIVGALRAGERLSTGEIAEVLGVSRPVAQRELAVLRDEGVIEWVGKSTRDPRAYWQLRTT